MSRLPPSRERICDVLEACRPGSSDLADPDFSDVARLVAENPHFDRLYEHIQESDQKLAVLFHEVEVPKGLDGRILKTLARAKQVEARLPALSIEKTADVQCPERIPVRLHRKDRAVSRRWLLVACGMLTSAVVLLGIAFWKNDPTGVFSEEMVLNEAIRFFDSDIPEVPGQLLETTPLPSPYFYGKSLLLLKGIRWRNVDHLLGQSGLAFDLPSQGGSRATLYAVRCSIPGLATTPALKPFTTGGCCSAVWQEEGLVYVLVVQGGPQAYRNYLDLPRGPVA